MARAGLRRHLIVIERPVETINTAVGGVDTSWEAWPARWADQKPGNGREFVAAQQLHAELTHLLSVLFDPERVITPTMRVLFNGAVLDILGCPRVRKSGQNEMQLLNCREIVDA